MLARNTLTLVRSSRVKSLSKMFGINKVIGSKKEWANHPYRKETDRPKYLLPEERAEMLKKAEADFLAEDNKGRLLEARHYRVEPRVEEDPIFGKTLPQLLDLTKASGSDLFYDDKSYDFDYLMKMYRYFTPARMSFLSRFRVLESCPIQNLKNC